MNITIKDFLLSLPDKYFSYRVNINYYRVECCKHCNHVNKCFDAEYSPSYTLLEFRNMIFNSNGYFDERFGYPFLLGCYISPEEDVTYFDNDIVVIYKDCDNNFVCENCGY